MPNHITNIVTLRGEQEDVKKAMNNLLSKEKDEFVVDFNKSFPMPKELEGTTSPAKIVSEEEYKKIKKEKKKDNPFGMPITQKMSNDYLKRFGANDWYSWRIKNWGTKWGGYNSYVIDENMVQFDTAWSTPFNFFVHFSKIHPNIEIVVEYADENIGSNTGKYILKAEQLINEELYNGVDAMIKALEITGSDSSEYAVDSLEDFEEKDITDEISNIYIQILYKNKYTEIHNPSVIKTLLLIAGQKEEYEYSIQLKKQLDSLSK